MVHSEQRRRARASTGILGKSGEAAWRAGTPKQVLGVWEGLAGQRAAALRETAGAVRPKRLRRAEHKAAVLRGVSGPLATGEDLLPAVHLRAAPPSTTPIPRP